MVGMQILHDVSLEPFEELLFTNDCEKCEGRFTMSRAGTVRKIENTATAQKPQVPQPPGSSVQKNTYLQPWPMQKIFANRNFRFFKWVSSQMYKLLSLVDFK